MKLRRPGFVASALAWLPLSILAISLLRDLPFLHDPAALLSTLPSLLLTAPCGLPLAFACRQILRLRHPVTAWTTFALLAPLTAVASLVAGLLGPLGIAIYATVLSLPAWILYAILRWHRRKPPPTRW